MSDQIARNVFDTLVRDFRLQHGKGFAEKAVQAFSSGLQDFRDYVFPTLGDVPVQRFKAYWQLQNLFKRYRFTTDRLSDDELKESTYDKYVKFQEHRSVYRPFRMSSYFVLQEARRICKRILCLPYETDGYRRNGRRAALGIPLSKAYFDSKWGDVERFSCPSALRKDFFQEIREDALLKPIGNRLLQRSKRENKPLNLKADTLDLTLVPKSWKTHRCITPLSVYGLYWSFGIGGYIEKCLRMSGLDITRLQDTHKVLARRYSRSRTHVTADLSSASDSLRSDILNRILPRRVYTDLRKTFCRSVTIEERVYHTVSCLPMGNGATFPVETLVFYCLIRAIGNLLKVNGVFSVYGDDLIYPRSIHTYVLAIFADLGIGINGDKTFVSSHFRESCGGDYYHGVDVRPALFPSARMPECGRLKQVQWLYNLLNTLRLRWSEEEIPHTVRYLISEIVYLHGKVFQVPKSFPTTSGYQVETPHHADWLTPFVYPKRVFEDGSTWYHTKFIGADKPKSRPVVYEDIYRWDAMRLVETVAIPPPVPFWSWGRYKCPGMTQQLAKWFLKSLRLLDGEARYVGDNCLHESTHSEGLTKVSVSRISAWT